ncbi:YHS domain-containing (seleno)protein [Brevirhabdus sp.]|uniref:YHS domain-containing (seleno)protein n=1 Tax=Brevirhabdus sp. TaxID=2004514 RepID=UPI004059E52B
MHEDTITGQTRTGLTRLPRRKVLSGGLGVLALGLTLPAAAWAARGRWCEKGGIAIAGYDAVAYHLQGRATPGTAELATRWGGVTWRFSTLANRERFEMDPDAYAPQYGGYCAYAVSRNYTTISDPSAWNVYEGRLFLTNSPAIFSLWRQDMVANIERADKNWPGVLEI